MHLSTSSAQRGASLIECVVALGIAAGALRLAAPAMQDLLQSMSLSAASQDLLMDLHVARTEALKRNRAVTLCKSADAVRCNAGGGWEQGWIVFDDANHNGRADDGEEVFRRHESLAADLRARGNQTVRDYVSYSPLGATKSRTGAFQAGTVTVCRVTLGKAVAREVIVNAPGPPARAESHGRQLRRLGSRG